MKVYAGIHELYSQYVAGTLLSRISDVSYKLSSILSRIKAIFHAWCTGGAESAEEFEQRFVEDSKRVRARIRQLQLKLNIVHAFTENRPDLKKLLQAALDEEREGYLEIELPKSDLTNEAIDTWGALLEDEYNLECVWRDLVRIVKNNKRVNKCFVRHIQKIEKAETISDADRRMLRLLHEKPLNAKPGFHHSLGLMVTGLGSPEPSV